MCREKRADQLGSLGIEEGHQGKFYGFPFCFMGEKKERERKKIKAGFPAQNREERAGLGFRS